MCALTPFLDQNGRLTAFPAKNKKKLLALWYLAEKLEVEKRYSEADINDLLDTRTILHDPATLRRELYNRHLLDRTPDGTLYWKAPAMASFEEFLARFV